MNETTSLAAFLGSEVVLDLHSQYVHLGRLTAEHPQYLVLEDADVHDLRDTSTTRELYVIDARRHGVNPNRKTVWVRKDQIISLSRLSDVLI